MKATDMPDKPHHGSNIRRFRELMDMKQDGLAIEMGGDWTQRKVSLLEQKETIDPEILAEVAKALKIPAKALESFTEKGAITYFNTFEEGSTNNGNNIGDSTYNINPLEKLAEAFNKNEELYRALLKEKDEKNALLEKLLARLKE
jgi:transcriptional regulator with XRE-family HTH domain